MYEENLFHGVLLKDYEFRMFSNKTLFLLTIFIFFFCTRKNLSEKFLPMYSYLIGTSDRLYRLLATVKDLFDKNDIPYSITGKILLSAVTNERLDRGDSTGMILVPESAIGKVLSLTDELLLVGLGFSDMPDGTFRIGGALTLPFFQDIAIHILPVSLAGDKWIIKSRTVGMSEWYTSGDLFPTKMYRLDNLYLPGPQNAVPYLQRNYWSHGIGLPKKVTNFNILNTPRIRNPAQMIQIPHVPRSVVIDDVRNDNYNYYGNNVRKINGMLVPHTVSPTKRTVLMGNGSPIIVPKVGISSPHPKASLWRRLFWS